MEKPTYKLVGAPCGHHGQYTFYKALRLTGERDKIFAIGDFFFVRIWQDSELVSIGELQLLWTDRVSDQTLVSLRLYFLPENTPDGRSQHGEDEVLAINDKVVLRAEDLLSWMCDGGDWRWGLRAVWRGDCAPPPDARSTAPLHHTKLDFSDVDKEKSTIEVDAESPGVVVFSYPRYCRYRALLARLDGIQADWLRDSLVAALGGYAAPTKNTRILYCKDTFEYPELEGHEFVCNHLAPRLKGRPRGRRRRPPRDRSFDRSSDSDGQQTDVTPPTPRRMSLRPPPESPEEDEEECSSAEDRAFLRHLKQFYKDRNETFKMGHSFKDLSLRALYGLVVSRGGYEAVSEHKLWRSLAHRQPTRVRRHYERFLLPYEKHERRNGKTKLNGKVNNEPRTVATIEVIDSPRRDTDTPKILRTPSPKPEKHIDNETGETKVEFVSKPAEELNREFLDSLPKEERPNISVKSVEKLFEPKVMRLLEEKDAVKDLSKCDLTQNTTQDGVLSDLSRKVDRGTEASFPNDLSSNDGAVSINGHANTAATDLKCSRPAGRSSLRAVRVKPTRAPKPQTPGPPASSPPAINNFGIHHPPPPSHSDDEIVEVPYKPKTPEIIDLDEYPESPQNKKKKLDILKERGLEVTAIPPTWTQPLAIASPIVAPAPIMLNPAVQHQIMTQAQLFQMYNMIPNYPNGLQPPKVIQGTGIYGSSGPEKTVYGNPKDPFMPPPHILHGTPVKPKNIIPTPPPQDILDLTCKASPPLPAVEILRLPAQSPLKNTPHNLTKNYLVDGKDVGSHLEITLVNKTPQKKPQKRSSNGKFVSAKTPTPPKDNPKPYACPSPSGLQKKTAIVVPSYQINRDEISPTSSTGSTNSQNNVYKNHMQMMDLQKSGPPPYLDPYMALYSSLATPMDQRQLAMYRDIMTNQFRGYGFNFGVTTPTTKN